MNSAKTDRLDTDRMDAESVKNTDQLKRWLLRGTRVRGSIVSLDRSWQEVVVRHEAPDCIKQSLGQLCAAGLLLATTIKFDGYLTLQIHGDGPVALFVVECEPDGSYRATWRARDGVVISNDADLTQLVNCNGQGRFAVTLSPRDKNQKPYQGIVSFEGSSVALTLEHYMQRSEQLNTRLWLAGSSQRAVGLLLQQMPIEGGKEVDPTAVVVTSAASQEPESDDNWNRMVQLAQTIAPEELLSLDSDEILRRLFWQEDLLLSEQKACQFRCQCSRVKVASMLQMLGQEEVKSIIEEQQQIEVKCEFCNTAYRFDGVDAASLFQADGSPVLINDSILGANGGLLQ